MKKNAVLPCLGIAGFLFILAASLPEIAAQTSDGVVHSYRGLEQKSWREVIDGTTRRWPASYTTHYPIHPAHSPDLLYVDRALNVARYRVLPDLRTDNLSAREARKQAESREMFALQFAFGEVPFLPNPQESVLNVPDKKLPGIEAEYYAWNILYKISYADAVIDGADVLAVKVAVTNDWDRPVDGAVWCKLNFQKEADFVQLDYRSFYWDNTKWSPSPSVSARGLDLVKDGRTVARFAPGDFKATFVEHEHFSFDAQNKLRFGSRGFQVPPSMHLGDVHQTMRLGYTLQSGETKEFELKIFVDFERPQPPERLDKSYAEVARKSADDFRAIYPPDTAELSFARDDRTGVFDGMQKGILQMLIAFPDRDSLMPSQGGVNFRHFIWPWEALFMTRHLLRTGHEEPVRKVVDYVFSLQDAGCPPSGDFVSLEGAIGTTGPRWANTTGSALILASEYYSHTGNKKFLDDYLDPMLRAAKWILGEIRATRKMNEDGTRPAWYGLLPFSTATDGNIGYLPSMTDAWSYMGLEKFAEVLRAIEHPFATELDAELAQYREDLNVAVRSMVREDGYIPRQIITGRPDEKVWPQTEHFGGSLRLAYCGVVDADSELMRRHFDRLEEHYVLDCFYGTMDRDVVYVGSGDMIAQDYYLRRGEWKKAFVAARMYFLYGMTPDTFLTQERYSKTSPTFACWQPNGSGNGRMLEMLLASIVFDDRVRDEATKSERRRLTPLGGIPFDWLKPSPLKLRKLRRPGGGMLNLETTPDGVLTLEWVDAATPDIIRIPETFAVVSHSDNLRKLDGGAGGHLFAPTFQGRSGVVTFRLADAERLP